MIFSVIGWTIIHSLWQCLGLLAVLKLILGFTDMRRSGARYAVALGVLGMAVSGVLATFIWEWKAFVPAAFSTAALAGGGAAVRSAGGVWTGGGMKDAGLLPWLAAACPYLTVGWVLGVVFYGVRLVLGGVGLSRLRRSPGITHGDVAAILEGLRIRMGVAHPLRLLITERVVEPMTFGVFRVVVVLPLSYASQVPAGQLEMILAHELAHIRRRDYVINLGQHVFDALLFFNPFYRMISAVVREEREYCCDDLAAVVAGDRRKMAEALTNLGLVKHGMGLGLSAVPERGSFYRRVSRLIEDRPVVSVRGILAGLLTAAVFTVGLTQCSRSVVAEAALPSPGDRMVQVLEDHQAGYHEQVFHYNKGGQEHELFLVRGQDEQQIRSAYVDGERVSQGELGALIQVLKETRNTKAVVALTGKLGELRLEQMKQRIYLSDSIEKQIQSKKMSGGDSTELVKLRLDLVQKEVELAMDQYMREMKHLPLDIEQHELLTRIVATNSYTAANRQQLNDLIRRRQAAEVRVEGRP